MDWEQKLRYMARQYAAGMAVRGGSGKHYLEETIEELEGLRAKNARLVEALREARDLLDAEEPRCKTTDECYQCTKMAEFDALLREYDVEK